MVKISPTHLLNQEITVISGGLDYDDFGIATFSQTIVSSGTARLQIQDVRTVGDGGVITSTAARAYVDPTTVSGEIGQMVEIDSQKFKINSVRDMIDGRGFTRLRILNLDEVGE